MHIKDGINRHDPLWHDFPYTRLGEGDLPLNELLDLLKNAGSDGYLSLEWESGSARNCRNFRRIWTICSASIIILWRIIKKDFKIGIAVNSNLYINPELAQCRYFVSEIIAKVFRALSAKHVITPHTYRKDVLRQRQDF